MDSHLDSKLEIKSIEHFGSELIKMHQEAEQRNKEIDPTLAGAIAITS